MNLTLKARRFALALLSSLFLSTAAHAERGISVGYQSTMSSNGPSIRYPLSEDFVVQGVLGALGTVTSATGRALLYVQDTEALDYYYYGQAGFWRYSNSFYDDSGLGLGIGVGLDYDLQEAIDNFVPLTLSLEAGMGYVAWDEYSGFDLLSIGIGIHYRLGE